MALHKLNDDDLYISGGYKIKSWEYECGLCGQEWTRENHWYRKGIDPTKPVICSFCGANCLPKGANFVSKKRAMYVATDVLKSRDDWPWDK